MRTFENGIYRDMTEQETAALEIVTDSEAASKDCLLSLAEGLSTVTSLAQVRDSAKAVLGGAFSER